MQSVKAKQGNNCTVHSSSNDTAKKKQKESKRETKKELQADSFRTIPFCYYGYFVHLSQEQTSFRP
jgi:hypothetical protein